MSGNSIVRQLSEWTKQHAEVLTGRGVEVTERFPEEGSPYPWKACIGLTYDGVIVTFTVWERTILQTELLVMNTFSGKLVVMDEGEPTSPSVIASELDRVTAKLLSGYYRRMDPDPKLTIT
jgi:hypothetical protein